MVTIVTDTSRSAKTAAEAQIRQHKKGIVFRMKRMYDCRKVEKQHKHKEAQEEPTSEQKNIIIISSAVTYFKLKIRRCAEENILPNLILVIRRCEAYCNIFLGSYFLSGGDFEVLYTKRLPKPWWMGWDEERGTGEIGWEGATGVALI